MKLRTPVMALMALTPLALIACGSDTTSSSPAASGGTNAVAVTLSEYEIQPATATVSAGEVTFTVENTGAVKHEMVVIRTDVAIADMLVEDHETNEEAPGMEPIGEVEDVGSGQTTDLTLTLDAGRYILLCNLPRHFEHGMVTEIQVA